MSQCGCLRKKGFDLQLGFRDCKTILLTDISKWIEGPGYALPESITVSVQIPYNGNSIEVVIPRGGTRVLTAKELLNSSEEQCLPDGVYCISTESCGTFHQINRAFLCSTQCQVDTIRAAGTKVDDFRDTARFQEMIDGIRINAEQGKSDKAGRLIQLLKQQLEKFNCACACSSGML